ncbi:MAG: hypothetical protein HOW73_23005 [Polyangiaceae bacterium]|nr:hypothetical protein [Polyangiaceae bacterium]
MRPTRALLNGMFVFHAASGCSATSNTAPNEPATAPTPKASEAAPASSRSDSPAPGADHTASAPDPACAIVKDLQMVQIAQGKTARTSLDVAVTYNGTEHDSYEGGRTDTIALLTFRGILENGELTPSALSWRPSALAPPTWTHLGSMPLCVRITDARQQGITLELFRANAR